MSAARQIIDEAIDPKRTLRSIKRAVQDLPTYLLQYGFKAGGPHESFQKQTENRKIRIVRTRIYDSPWDSANSRQRQGPVYGWWLRAWTFDRGDWRPFEDQTFASDEDVIRHLEHYRGFLEEAIDPKRVLRQTTRRPQGKLIKMLDRDRWEPSGSSPLSRKRTLGGEGEQKRTYYVWFDERPQQWVVKKEGQKHHFGSWRGWHDLGFATFNTEDEVIAYLKARAALYIWPE